MNKRILTATFSNGHTISRKTAKNYTHAYCVEFVQTWNNNRVCYYTGFASSAALAQNNLTPSLSPEAIVNSREVVEVSL